jgi:hypothetical protein
VSEVKSFQLLQWSTDSRGLGIALINGRTYSHDEVRRLRDELAEVARIGNPAPSMSMFATAADYNAAMDEWIAATSPNEGGNAE